MSIAASAATSPTISARRDRVLLEAYAATGRSDLRARLVDRYLPIARYAASRFARSAELFDDLLQVACIGLLKAIDRYDPSRGVEFSSYALPTINGELRRHFRDHSWNVRPPRDLQEDALRVERIAEQIRAEDNRTPTVDDIARRGGMTVEQVLEAREALSARYATSLSSQGGDGGDDDAPAALEARLGAVDDGFERAEQRALLDGLARALTTREREIVRLRFEEDLTQAEIGALLGLSQMHVSRLLRAALKKLSDTATAASAQHGG